MASQRQQTPHPNQRKLEETYGLANEFDAIKMENVTIVDEDQNEWVEAHLDNGTDLLMRKSEMTKADQKMIKVIAARIGNRSDPRRLEKLEKKTEGVLQDAINKFLISGQHRGRSIVFRGWRRDESTAAPLYLIKRRKNDPKAKPNPLWRY